MSNQDSVGVSHLPIQDGVKASALDNSAQVSVLQPTDIVGGWSSTCYRYGMMLCIGALCLYILYYSYCNFCDNQNIEPYIEKTVRTGIADDKSFDVEAEVKRLSDMQEKYLRKLNSQRNF